MEASSPRAPRAAGEEGVPREAYAEPAPTPPLTTAARHAFAMFRAHDMTDWGASMTYYLIMSLFPALLVGISLLGLFGQQSLVTDSVQYLRDAGAPKQTVDAVDKSLTGLIEAS